jgi:general secretion pathway protein D
MKISRCILFFVVTACAVMPAFSQEADDQGATRTGPKILRGNDVVIAPAKPGRALQGAAAGLKFEDAPLADVVHVILREMLKVNYIVHPPIAGTVTLSTQGNLSVDDAMLMLEYALQANGYLIAVDPRGTYHIGRPEIIKAIVPAVRQVVKNSPLSPGYGTVIIPLKYVGAAEMAAILRPVAPAEAMVRIDTVRNLLVMMGNRTQTEGWLDMVATFDVDLLQGMSVGVFPLKYTTTKEIDLALRALTGTFAAGSGASPGAASGATGGAAGSGSVAGSAAAALPANFPLYGALRIVPIDRLNSILVVTPRAAYLDEARKWIEKLDKPGINGGEPQLFVYPVQNGSAAHLASVLGGLFGGGGGATASNAGSGVAPGLVPATGSTAGVSSGGSKPAGLASNTGQSSIQGSGIKSVSLDAGLRVIADEINNAILVYGTAADFSKVEATLKRLDVPPTQVMIEASIIEVSLSDDLKYGLQWVFSDGAHGGSALNGTGVLSNIAGAALGPVGAGFSYTLRNAAGDVRAVLSALAEKSLVRVISSPSLMVLDNHTASIAVGNQQPIRVGETVTDGGNITTNIQYKDTGLNLSVTPSVNAGNMVTMLVNQSITDVGSIDVATGQRSFLQRQFASKVAVRSGETLVLGGLIRDNTTSGKSGLPGLHDIPLIGNLFGTSTNNVNRTELLVIITPKVVRSDQDLRELSADLRVKMKSLDWGWAVGTAPAQPEPGPATKPLTGEQ